MKKTARIYRTHDQVLLGDGQSWSKVDALDFDALFSAEDPHAWIGDLAGHSATQK